MMQRNPDTPVAGAGNSGLLLCMVLSLLYAVVAMQNAWLSDDAYITLRSVDNFLHGYGMRWNIDERVQSFTHPLWFFLLSLGGLVTGEFIYSTYALSLVCAVAAFWVLVRHLAHGVWPRLFVFAACILSKAYVDYSTSGLENALTFLLLALFCLRWNEVLQQEESANSEFLEFRLPFLAALVACNRLDAILLVFPALCVLAYRRRSWKQWGGMCLAFWPLLAWESFSLIYYGVAFPNTAYAKLSTGISQKALLLQSAHYYCRTLTTDSLTLLVIGAALLLPLFRISRRKGQIALCLGIFCYLTYICKIGGDFMAGRFFAGPLFVALVLLAKVLPDKIIPTCPAAVLLLLLGLLMPGPTIFTSLDYTLDADNPYPLGIADEKSIYFKNTGLLPRLFLKDCQEHRWETIGRKARGWGRVVIKTTNVGMLPFYAGPAVHVIDFNALTDPLLARLPIRKGKWRIGHFTRNLPDGYADWFTGKDEIHDPQLREYHQRLLQLTRGELWSAERWKEILRFLTGRNDHLLQSCISRQPASG